MYRKCNTRRQAVFSLAIAITLCTGCGSGNGVTQPADNVIEPKRTSPATASEPEAAALTGQWFIRGSLVQHNKGIAVSSAKEKAVVAIADFLDQHIVGKTPFGTEDPAVRA